MEINVLSITFWFNIYDNHTNILEILQKELKDEFTNFNIKSITNNLVEPIINTFNEEKRSNLTMSQINLQYTMQKTTLDNFENFKERCFQLFELLLKNNIEVLHTAMFINREVSDEYAIQKISNNILNKNVISDDLVDTSVKLAKKEEDLFYKIVTLTNKKQMKLPKKVDKEGRIVPIPLISWYGAFVENEIIDISYEINDKYLFDFTKDYHTTEFYLNKMLYLLIDNYETDIDNLMNKGEF